jgi:hypothetical protein
MLASIDLEVVARQLRAIGVDSKSCRTLDAAHLLATTIVASRDKPIERVALLLAVLQVPEQYHKHILDRWWDTGYEALPAYAPFSAHILTGPSVSMTGVTWHPGENAAFDAASCATVPVLSEGGPAKWLKNKNL